MVVGQNDYCGIHVRIRRKMFFDCLPVTSRRIVRLGHPDFANGECRIAKTEQLCESSFVVRVWNRDSLAKMSEKGLGSALHCIWADYENIRRSFGKRVLAERAILADAGPGKWTGLRASGVEVVLNWR